MVMRLIYLVMKLLLLFQRSLLRKCLVSLSVNHLPFYVSYECSLRRDATVADNPESSATSPVTDSITDFLMKKCNHYFSLRPDSNKNNIKQYNALVNLTRENKCGVQGSYLSDFESFLSEFV